MLRLPNHEDHCLHSLRRCGVRGDDVHAWMDAPSVKYGIYHRRFRHNGDAVWAVAELFGPKYGTALAQAIAVDHIQYDREQTIMKMQYANNNYRPAAMGKKGGLLFLIFFAVAMESIIYLTTTVMYDLFSQMLFWGMFWVLAIFFAVMIIAVLRSKGNPKQFKR